MTASGEATRVGAGTRGETTGLVISGGSLKAESQSGQILGTQPYNKVENGEAVYLAVIPARENDNALAVSSGDVEGALTREGGHPDDPKFYSYLPGFQHAASIAGMKYNVSLDEDQTEFLVTPFAPVIQSATATDKTIVLTTDAPEWTANTILYRWKLASDKNAPWSQWATGEQTGLKANTAYTVGAKYSAEHTPQESPVSEPFIVTTAPSVTVRSGVTATYGATLSHATGKPANWEWVKPTDLVGDAGSPKHDAYLMVSPAEDDVTWTGLPEECSYKAGADRVVCKVAVTVGPADTSITIMDVPASRPYDTTGLAAPTVKITGSAVEPVKKWQVKNAKGGWDDWQTTGTESSPTHVGTYQYVVSVDADTNHTNASKAAGPITITQAGSSWKANPSVQNWTYGQEAKIPTAEPTYGKASDVVFSWRKITQGDGSMLTPTPVTNQELVAETLMGAANLGLWSQGAPTQAGDYWLIAQVPSSSDYRELVSSVHFAIAPAKPTVTVTPIKDRDFDGNPQQDPTVTVTGVDGQLNVTPDLVWQVKDGDAWKTVRQPEVKAAGTYQVIASVKAAGNYTKAESAPAQFTIRKAGNGWTTEPSIAGNGGRGSSSGGSSPIEWVAGDPAPSIDPGDASHGQPVITWRDAEGKPVDGVPTKPGTYTVTITVPGTGDWGEVSKSFEVTILPIPQVDSMTLTDANGAKVLERYLGEKATVTVEGVYVPEALADNPEVAFTLHSTPVELGQAKVVDGKASLEFTVPEVELGEHTIEASLSGQKIGEVPIKVLAKPVPAAGGDGQKSGTSGKSALARTGAVALPYLLTGALLVAAGGLVLALRRRQS